MIDSDTATRIIVAFTIASFAGGFLGAFLAMTLYNSAMDIGQMIARLLRLGRKKETEQES